MIGVFGLFTSSVHASWSESMLSVANLGDRSIDLVNYVVNTLTPSHAVLLRANYYLDKVCFGFWSDYGLDLTNLPVTGAVNRSRPATTSSSFSLNSLDEATFYESDILLWAHPLFHMGIYTSGAYLILRTLWTREFVCVM